jgi:hypothetical protein
VFRLAVAIFSYNSIAYRFTAHFGGLPIFVQPPELNQTAAIVSR